MDVELVNTTRAMIAESNLLSVRDNIDKNKTKIATEEGCLMVEIRTKAKACRGGNKDQRRAKLKKVLPLMQRLKRFRQQTALANQQLGLLNAQLNAFENGRFQKEMTDTLRASVVAMKKVGISETGDNVYDIVDDLQDTITQQNQLSESLSVSLVNTMDESSASDDALMRELMAMVGDDEDDIDQTIPIVLDTGGVHSATIIPRDTTDIPIVGTVDTIPVVMEVGAPVSPTSLVQQQPTDSPTDPQTLTNPQEEAAIA